MSSDRFKGRPKQGEDKFATLKAWVHWVLLYPLDEHQEAHAKATNDLFALLGTREAELEDEKEKSARLVELIEKVINNESINYELAAPAPYRTGLTVGHLLANQLVRDALAASGDQSKDGVDNE